MAKQITLPLDAHRMTGMADAICILARNLHVEMANTGIVDPKTRQLTFELAEKAREVLRAVSYDLIPDRS